MLRVLRCPVFCQAGVAADGAMGAEGAVAADTVVNLVRASAAPDLQRMLQDLHTFLGVSALVRRRGARLLPRTLRLATAACGRV